MTTYLFITIDTEEDQWGEYGNNNYSTENIKRLPELQKIFMKYGAVPTFLINYAVAESDDAIRILRDIQSNGSCEIGTHCHPWNTPPLKESKNLKNSMMCNLDDSLVQQKMEVLHETITRRFDRSPVCFRAGRWGLGPGVANSIHRLGYLVDSSVSPFVDWGNDGGPDYGMAPTHAYRFDPDHLLSPKPDGKLLEIPATVGFYQKNFKLCHRAMRWISKHSSKKLHLLGILSRVRLLNFRWLSPELNTGEGMVHLARTFVKTGHAFLNLSFHSTSLLPGLSPFVRNDEDYKRFIADLETFLQYAVANGMTFVPLAAANDLQNNLM